MEMSEEQIPSEICGDFEGYTLARFIFLAFTSLIALLGTFGNLLLIYIFSTRKYPNTPPTLYPTVLAVLDTLLCALYIMLFGVDAAIVYLRVESLFVLYHLYIVPAYVLSRITQLAIPYMLIFGTLERFVWISGRKNAILKNMYSVRGRHITMSVTLLCCIGLRLPTTFATVVNEFPNCTDFFRSKSTGPADWVLDNAAYYFFDFHLLSIAQTFIPFLVLLVFNLVIVRKLAKEREETEEERVNEWEKGGGRERSKSSLLRDPTDANLASTFHTVFSDTVSFVYMFTSAIRLIVYCICDPTTRKDVRQVINVCEQQNKKVTSVFVSVQNYSCAIFI
ncbi:hypothetical protein Tcan_14231 [Toxocara canis]|uniref:G-protein coupled receptors family 1 profile domain-containing protein n=1 Tax=Toxocara canis TaxID=6265 RepID=A0A0B2VNB9_TOXCA|nr:hypothetical protein Tcan_14231 [Toxocara canis]